MSEGRLKCVPPAREVFRTHSGDKQAGRGELHLQMCAPCVSPREHASRKCLQMCGGSARPHERSHVCAFQCVQAHALTTV